MSMQFYYEDGQGHIDDEHGVQPMDLVVDEELYAIETISSQRQSNPVILPTADERNCDVDMELCNKRRYTVYSYEDKTRFFHLFFSKCLNASAAAAARQLGIHIWAAQRWVKRYYEDPESIFEKKKNQGDVVFLGMSISNFF
ncbi:hypothetical protein K501DRAFT_281166 [Backusella circina FSU 941]|nr:hypothetical protein K501DRAFT_281166 [Backusella circina FSU 941]